MLRNIYFPTNFADRSWIDASKIEHQFVPHAVTDSGNQCVAFLEHLKTTYEYNFGVVCGQFINLVKISDLNESHQCIDRLADPEHDIISVRRAIGTRRSDEYNLYVLNFVYLISNDVDWQHLSTLVKKYRTWHYRWVIAHDRVQHLLFRKVWLWPR